MIEKLNKKRKLIMAEAHAVCMSVAEILEMSLFVHVQQRSQLLPSFHLLLFFQGSRQNKEQVGIQPSEQERILRVRSYRKLRCENGPWWWRAAREPLHGSVTQTRVTYEDTAINKLLFVFLMLLQRACHIFQLLHDGNSFSLLHWRKQNSVNEMQELKVSWENAFSS